MDELVTWLSAQWDEDEVRTRKLLTDARRTVLTLKDPRHLGKFIPGWHDWPDVERMCTDRLADIAAKRRILDEHSPGRSYRDDGKPVCRSCRRSRLYPCNIVRLLALPMAGRDGYRSEWAP